MAEFHFSKKGFAITGHLLQGAFDSIAATKIPFAHRSA
jgi:hypothetical protein